MLRKRLRKRLTKFQIQIFDPFSTPVLGISELLNENLGLLDVFLSSLVPLDSNREFCAESFESKSLETTSK